MFPPPSPTPTILTSPIPVTGPYSSKIFISPISIHHLPEIFTSKLLPLARPYPYSINYYHATSPISVPKLPGCCPLPPLTSPMSVPKPPHRTNPPKIQTSLISVPNPTILTSPISVLKPPHGHPHPLAYNINISNVCLKTPQPFMIWASPIGHIFPRTPIPPVTSPPHGPPPILTSLMLYVWPRIPHTEPPLQKYKHP